jgi:hypothetical protein
MCYDVTGNKYCSDAHNCVFGDGSSPGLVMWDFVVDKVALGQVFSEYFGFPCQF